MRHSSKIAAVAVATLLLAGSASAQDAEKSVDGKLLQILKQRGVISDAEYGELKALETDLKRQASVEEQVNVRVDEAVARMVQDAPKVSYKPGSGFGFKSADGNFSLTIGGRLQIRFTDDFNEKEVPNNTDGDDRQNFAVQRLRLWFKGNAWDPKLHYEAQFDVAGETVTAGSSTSANKFASLREGWIEYEFDPAFLIKGGQFKVPFSRQQLNSSGRQGFVDRAPTDPVFAPGREPGLMVYGKLGGAACDLFEYSVGVFNGEGTNTNNDDDGLEYAARVAVNPFGGLAYAEADLRPEEDRKNFRLAFGVSALYENDDFGSNGDANRLNNEDDWRLGADLTMAWYGFYSQTEVFNRNIGDVADRDIFGWYSQLSYMIVPERFEVGLRYAAADWEYSNGGIATFSAATRASLPTAAREYLIVLGYYWHGHDLKAQLDFGRVEDHRVDRATSSSDFDEWRLRFQVTLAF